MKIRNGFVSNSSTTSFTCDVCGEEASGQDMSPNECGMICFYECDHIYCEEHDDCGIESKITKEIMLDFYSNDKEIVEKINSLNDKEYLEWLEDEGEDYYNELKDEPPSSLCAICNMRVFDQSMVIDYMIKKTGITKDEVFKDIKKENKRRKKLHPYEYFEYVCNKIKLTRKEVEKEIKEKFNSFDEFHSFIYG